MTNPLMKKIMAVDDEETALFFVSKILERAGYQVVKTSKAKEAFELAQKEKPDAILLDIVMPEMNGSEIAARLAADQQTASIPVIFLSAILTKDEENLIQKTGKHYVVSKPVTGPELVAKIKKVLETR